jgi:hypothetical protein
MAAKVEDGCVPGNCSFRSEQRRADLDNATAIAHEFDRRMVEAKRERDEARAACAAMRAALEVVIAHDRRIENGEDPPGGVWLDIVARLRGTLQRSDAGRDILDALAAAEAALRGIVEHKCVAGACEIALAKIEKARGAL